MPKTLERLDSEAKADISEILKHSGFKNLATAVALAQNEFFENLAKEIASSREPVNQRELDEKRGFWAGATWAVTAMPYLVSLDYEKFIKEALKEADQLAGTR